jgi:hypothetical protein
MARTFLVKNGDAVADPGGRPKVVTGGPKAKQDLAEMLAVETQADGFGAGIVGLVGTDAGLDDGMGMNIEFTLRSRIEDGFKRLVGVQQRTLGNRTPADTFARLVNLQASQDRVDPTLYRWRVDAQTVDGQVQTLKGVMEP